MEAVNLDKFRDKDFVPTSSPSMPETLDELTIHLADNINRKLQEFDKNGTNIEVFGPEWARENSALAGQMHADIIVETYGTTYALPNKDPVANQQAIESGDLDVYLMKVDGVLSGTTCLVNTHDGRAELGRSAALDASGASVILDYRILNWLTDDETAEKYHTLFTTLRTAPNRDAGFDMRGGQAVTAHWKKFPGLEVNGFGPLYLKHGSLEQFSCASLTRAVKIHPDLFVADDESKDFVAAWHDNYTVQRPTFTGHAALNTTELKFDAHYPPLETGLTEYVHADIVQNPEGASIQDAIRESEEAGSPFVQVVVPIDGDTRALQSELKSIDYQAFSYQPGTNLTSPALVFGHVSPGSTVVETFWHNQNLPNPLWRDKTLADYALRVALRW
ncbi:hypothetical protein H7100_02280 [Candidatus Saccharibacteria bacterium]|nr:hypothetical protein [Candidatus Saccharibacteria bacterium]